MTGFFSGEAENFWHMTDQAWMSYSNVFSIYLTRKNKAPAPAQTGRGCGRTIEEFDMSEVTWRRHPVHEFYEVSSDGRVRRSDHTLINTLGARRHYPVRELTQRINAWGYLTVAPWCRVKKRQLTIAVHILVCETFHGPKPTPKHEVRHLNGIATDNRPENLAWGTHAENMQDRVTHGTHPFATRTHCPQGHPYDEENTRYDKKSGGRICRSCHRERERIARTRGKPRLSRSKAAKAARAAARAAAA